MIVFWSIAAIIIVLTLALLLSPFWRSKKASSTHARTLSEELYRQRTAELDAEREQQNLSSAQYEQIKGELDRDFLNELQPEASPSKNTAPSSGKWTALGTGLLVIAVSVGWYYQSGQLDAITGTPQQVATTGQADSQLPPLEEMVDKLKQRLKAEPQDGQGWALLGRTYSILRQYDKANRAYEVAYGIVGDKPDLLANYAENLAIGNDYQLQGKPADLIEKALKIDPNQPRALWLGGMASFQKDDYRTAIDRWQSLIKQMPADSEDIPALQQYIDQAYTALGETPPAASGLAATNEQNTTPPSSAGKTDATAHAIQVTVTLDEKLRELVQPTDTLFIFARAVNGPRAPLAVTRVQVSALPITIELNDSMAMAPQFKLSGFDNVVVGARISKTGSVMPTTGDLQGLSAALNLPHSQLLHLSIDTVMP